MRPRRVIPDGDVRRSLERRFDPRTLRLDAGGAAISAQRPWPRVAASVLKRPPAAHARSAGAEASGGPDGVTGTVGDGLQGPGVKIEGEAFDMAAGLRPRRTS